MGADGTGVQGGRGAGASRTPLPARRPQVTADVAFEGHTYAVSAGFDEVGAVREVFVTGQRQGSTLDATLDDAAIIISHHLQRGGTAKQLRRSMSRLGGGLGSATSPASPIGAVVDLVAGIQAEVSRQTEDA